MSLSQHYEDLKRFKEFMLTRDDSRKISLREWKETEDVYELIYIENKYIEMQEEENKSKVEEIDLSKFH